MTLSITVPSILGLTVTLSVKFHFSECHFLIVMLNDITLNVLLLSTIMLFAVMLSAVHL